MCEKTVLVIGEVFVDTHIDEYDENADPLVRLGGIFHSARAYSSIGTKYALAYYAPKYLEDDINKYSCVLNTDGCYELGFIDKSPNIMIVRESKEISNQGYANPLRKQAVFNSENSMNILDIVEIVKPTDILIYPGRYNTSNMLRELKDYKGKIHIDFHYDAETLLDDFSGEIETLIISTSSNFFKNECKASLDGTLSFFEKKSINKFLVKENRGGSYLYSVIDAKRFDVPSYIVPTAHSVGVGDVYNSFIVSDFFTDDILKKMKLASLCASKYAETFDFESFKENVQNILEHIDEMITLKGIRLPWEDRKNLNIYIAAPDFPDVNTSLLNMLGDALNYHNFVPRFPVRENGLATTSVSEHDSIEMYYKDMSLLETCDLLIAVLLYNDPGTLVELGIFKQMGKPTIIFDPYNYCINMFVKNSADVICKTMEEVIASTYKLLNKE